MRTIIRRLGSERQKHSNNSNVPWENTVMSIYVQRIILCIFYILQAWMEGLRLRLLLELRVYAVDHVLHSLRFRQGGQVSELAEMTLALNDFA